MNPDWLDPIHGVGYQFWSGIGTVIVPAWIGFMIYLTPTRCEQLGCRRKARAVNKEGVILCDRHLNEK